MKVKTTKFDYFEICTLENDCAVNKAISEGVLWEPHIINYLKINANKNKDFVDIGSNFGWHSLIAHKHFNHVHSFEPQESLCILQQQSVKNSNISNISVHNVALSDCAGTGELNPVSYDSTFNTGDVSIGSGGEFIDIKTLDSYQLSNIAVIKIDVQGLEYKVIQGAERTIWENRPDIIVELENIHLVKQNTNARAVMELLRSMNYYCFFMDYSYPADHLFVHYDNLREFREYNKNYINKHTTNNDLNFNLDCGVFEKVSYV